MKHKLPPYRDRWNFPLSTWNMYKRTTSCKVTQERRIMAKKIYRVGLGRYRINKW